MFCLELHEPYLVTGTRPIGLLKMFVEHAVSDEGKHSALTWKLQVCEGGSDLTCKTNSTLPSFVKSREEVSMHRANFRLSSRSNDELVFNRLLNSMNFNQMSLFTSKKRKKTHFRQVPALIIQIGVRFLPSICPAGCFSCLVAFSHPTFSSNSNNKNNV